MFNTKYKAVGIASMLDKEDLINLVTSSSPNYEIMEREHIQLAGSFMGGFHDKWVWKKEILEGLNLLQLFSLYYECKNSWK